jgi:hypothetical protein
MTTNHARDSPLSDMPMFERLIGQQPMTPFAMNCATRRPDRSRDLGGRD